MRLRSLWRRSGRMLSAFAGLIAISACAPSLPTDYDKPVTRAVTDTGGTYLAGQVRAFGDPGDGRTGIYLVQDGPESLALRLLMSDRAERTIDAQYYLLHNDSAGHLFAWRLLEAAERGVRVRLLLDDMDTASYDAMTAALDEHPNIEIRLFNPFRRGFGRNVASLFEFERVNRRMHNKSMTFDNVVTLVGGRNIGDEYFAAREDSNYNDLDVLALGPVARQVSDTFDAYWNSDYAVPARVAIGEKRATLSLDEAKTRLRALGQTAAKTEYGKALTHGIRGDTERRRIDVKWVPARLIADPPEKAAKEADADEIVAGVMMPYVRAAERDLFVSSAYFVPRARGTEMLTDLSQRGVEVTILTNSIDSTDVLPVYGHYATSRDEMLEGGVNLWELRADGQRADRARLGLGLSQSSLHTKAFAIDRRYLFVGSFNWDPRSVWINNEMGVLIDSEVLARDAVAAFERNIRLNAYELRLDEAGDIDWIERKGDGMLYIHKAEPSESGWRKFMSGVYGALPIGGQL